MFADSFLKSQQRFKGVKKPALIEGEEKCMNPVVATVHQQGASCGRGWL